MGSPDRVDLISSRTEYYEYPSALPTVERGSIKLDLLGVISPLIPLRFAWMVPITGSCTIFGVAGMICRRESSAFCILSHSSMIPPACCGRSALNNASSSGLMTDTLGLIHRAVPLLGQISGQRARHELDLFFEEARFSPKLSKELLRSGCWKPSIQVWCYLPERWEMMIDSPGTSRFREGMGSTPNTLFSLPHRTALIYIAWLGQPGESEGISASKRLRFTAEFSISLRQVYRGRRIIERLCRSTTESYRCPSGKNPTRCALYSLFRNP